MSLSKEYLKMLAIVLAGLFVWSVHKFAYELASMLLKQFEIVDPLWINGWLIIIFGATLILLGTPIKKLFNR